MFIDIEERIYLVSIYRVLLIEIPARINLHNFFDFQTGRHGRTWPRSRNSHRSSELIFQKSTRLVFHYLFTVSKLKSLTQILDFFWHDPTNVFISLRILVNFVQLGSEYRIFENWTICPIYFRPFENRACPVFRSSLYLCAG